MRWPDTTNGAARGLFGTPFERTLVSDQVPESIGPLVDNLSTEARSAQMRLVRSKDSKAELTLRSWTHRLGYRFRLHRRDVPGQPDISMRSRRKAVFMHGCFWHRHDCASGRRLPKSRTAFWTEKLEQNRKRDVENLRRLADLGWTALVIWECEMRDRADVERKLRGFLDA